MTKRGWLYFYGPADGVYFLYLCHCHDGFLCLSILYYWVPYLNNYEWAWERQAGGQAGEREEGAGSFFDVFKIPKRMGTFPFLLLGRDLNIFTHVWAGWSSYLPFLLFLLLNENKQNS